MAELLLKEVPVTRTRRTDAERGFSLIELLIAVALIGIVAGIAVGQWGVLRPGFVGDGAMRVVMAQLNMARETAVTQRRSITVRFVGTNMLRVTNGGEVTDIGFEGGVKYSLMSNIGDTPDAFGVASPTTFGSISQTQIRFNSEGSLVDSSNSPINGTVFLAVPELPLSFRAVTVLGSTGRVRAYKWDGRQWKRA
jgi:prepilin-type N-terminal cleavage/methylation domain-containing protein